MSYGKIDSEWRELVSILDAFIWLEIWSLGGDRCVMD